MLRTRLSRLVITITVVAAVAIAVPLARGGVAHATVLTCTSTFTNGDSTLTFNDAGNWSPPGIPTSGVACMSGYTVTLSAGSASVGAVQGGTLIVESPLTLADTATTSELDGLTLESTLDGPLTGTSTLDVNGNMTWGAGSTGAQFDASGSTLNINQPSSDTFDIAGTGQVYDIGGTVSTHSPIDITDPGFIGDNIPTVSTTSTVTISPTSYVGNGGGGVDIEAPGFLLSGSTAMPDFNLIVTGTTSSITGTGDVLSANQVNVPVGGSLTIPTGDSLENADSTSLIAGTLTGAGTFINVGAMTISGTLTSGEYEDSTGTTTVDAGSTVTPTALVLNGGQFNLEGNASATTFSESSGAMNAEASAVTLTLTGAATWSGGEISGGSSDVLTVSQGSGTSFDISGSNQDYLIGDTISTESPIDLTATQFLTTVNPQDAVVTTTSTLTFGTGVVGNQGGGTFSAAGLGAYTGGDTTYGFDGDPLTLTGGASTIPTGATFEACGIHVTGGTLRLDGTFDDDGCRTSTVSGGTLSGTGTFDGTLTTESGGDVEPGDSGAPGTLTVVGPFTNDGTLTIPVTAADDYSELSTTQPAVEDGTVAMDAESYTPPLATTFAVLQGTGTLTDTSTTVTPAGHYLATASGPTLDVTAEEVSSVPLDAHAVAGDEDATVSFTAPSSDGGGAIESYTVTADDHTTSAHGGETCGSTAPTTTCQVDGLTNGDRYTFTVTATNPVGASGPSEPSNEVTPATVPDAPTTVSAGWGASSSLVSWRAPSVDGGAPVTRYTVTATDETTPAHGGQTCSVTVTKTSKDQCTVSSLTNGDLYEFTVVAINTAGPSAPSTPTSGVYPSAPPTLKLSPSRLVLPKDTSDSTTCTVSVLQATSCAVVVTGPKGVVIARGTATSAGASSLTVKVTVTSAGTRLAQPVGGVTGVLVATVVLTNGETLRAAGSLQIVEQVSKITLAGSILFASGSSKVSAAGVKTIRALAKTLKGANEAECDGYTDNVGSPAANRKLGLARAKAVCAILAPNVKRTKSVSYGDADPVATNKTAAGRAKNRRVVIKVTN